MKKYPSHAARRTGFLLFAALFVGACGSDHNAGTAPTPFANPTAPSLTTASTFVVLGASAVTNTGGTAIVGDLGVSAPGISPTGFPPGTITGATHPGDSTAAEAQSALTVTYDALAAKTCDTPLTGQDLGARALTRGVYCFTSSAQLTGTLTLNGDAASVFVFKIASALNTASNSAVVMTGGALARNVYWQVGSSATLGANTSFMGNIIAYTSVSLGTGASLTGRAMARNGAVTMAGNAITMP